ncbi:MAG: OmpA family protein [Bacteroidetes bacterium]|nr:OmpA family protein [Bacteroidota bacterium]
MLNTFYFSSDSFELGNDDLEKMDKFVDFINGLNYEYYLRVLGCSDSSGECDSILDLSKLRAGNVKKHLIERNISEDNISCFYFGEYNHFGGNPRKVIIQIICEE